MIRSFQDTEIAVRQLEQRLEALENGNQDMRGNRIINAGQSVNDSDYVTRAELLRIQTSENEDVKIAPGWLQVDFTLVTPVVGDDVAPNPVPWIPHDTIGIPVICGVRVRTPPSGGSLQLRWNHYSKETGDTVDLLNGALLTVNDGENYSKITTFYPNRNISTQDYFTIDIVDVNDAAGLYTFLAMMVP